jgi:hypothetical protein
MSILTNPITNKILGSGDIITSSEFLKIKNNHFLTLEGAYIAYQLSNVNIYIRETTPDLAVDITPSGGDFYFKTTDEREEYKYDEDTLSWQQLTKPLLDQLIKTGGFSSDWFPVNTVRRGNSVEVLIPANYLSLNFNESPRLFIGFKNTLTQDIHCSLGIPLTDGLITTRENTSIGIPFNFNCGFIPTKLDSTILEMESTNLNTTSMKTNYNINTFLSKYKSTPSEETDYGMGRLLGTNLNFD